MTTSPGRSTKRKFDVIAPEVARLAAKGLSRAAIARELQVAPSTVARAAEVVGVTFNSESTAPATEAAQVQARDRRVLLTDAMYSAAAKSVRRLHGALDADEPADARSYATVTGIVVDKIIRLEPEVDHRADSQEDAKQALTALMTAIRDSVPDDDEDLDDDFH
jgi:hypothetical protein